MVTVGPLIPKHHTESDSDTDDDIESTPLPSLPSSKHHRNSSPSPPRSNGTENELRRLREENEMLRERIQREENERLKEKFMLVPSASSSIPMPFSIPLTPSSRHSPSNVLPPPPPTVEPTNSEVSLFPPPPPPPSDSTIITMPPPPPTDQTIISTLKSEGKFPPPPPTSTEILVDPLPPTISDVFAPPPPPEPRSSAAGGAIELARLEMDEFVESPSSRPLTDSAIPSSSFSTSPSISPPSRSPRNQDIKFRDDSERKAKFRAIVEEEWEFERSIKQGGYFKKHELVWKFTLQGERFRLRLVHSPVGGKRVITLNNEKMYSAKVVGASITSFKIGVGKIPVRVIINYALSGCDYDLEINGRTFEMAKEFYLNINTDSQCLEKTISLPSSPLVSGHGGGKQPMTPRSKNSFDNLKEPTPITPRAVNTILKSSASALNLYEDEQRSGAGSISSTGRKIHHKNSKSTAMEKNYDIVIRKPSTLSPLHIRSQSTAT